MESEHEFNVKDLGFKDKSLREIIRVLTIEDKVYFPQ